MAQEEYYGDSEPTPETKDNSGANTGLLPKEFFQGKELEIGSRCEVEIQRVHDTQVEVTYVPHTEDEPRKSEVESAQPVDAEMADMMDY